eukprot:634720-Pelagomonas_calceolata.AAC.2
MQKLNPRTSPGLSAVSGPLIKYAEKRVPAVNGERRNVLAPYVARLFAAIMEKAEIPACWKAAKLTPLYKKGSLLDPASYRMLAVSDILYRMYANALRDVVTGWCRDKNKIPDSQYVCNQFLFCAICSMQHRFSALMHLPGCIQHSLILSKRMIHYLGKHYGLISSVFAYQPACWPS